MNVAIGLIVALVLGGGTSVSAEQAVPGDLLYPVKTEINENVRGALTFGAEGEANWNARVAERRLEEAEQLAAENRLDAETTARLKNAFEVHAERADGFATDLEERGDNDRAAEVRSDMQAHFEAHGNIISSIARNIGTSTEAGARVDELLSTVRARAESASNARARAEISAETDAEPRASQAVESKIANAERAIARAQNALDDMETEDRAELKAQAQTQLDLAGEKIAEANASIEAEAHAGAFRLAQQAQRIATRVLVFVRNTNVIDISGDAGIGIGVVGRGYEDDNATTTDDDTEEGMRGNDRAQEARENRDNAPDDAEEEDRDEEDTDRQRLFAAVRAHLAQQTDVSAENIEVVSVESQQWSDGCLGLGGPAESCLQAITPGYEVTVRIDGELHVYRTDADGSQVREDTEASVDIRGEVDVDLR